MGVPMKRFWFVCAIALLLSSFAVVAVPATCDNPLSSTVSVPTTCEDGTIDSDSIQVDITPSTGALIFRNVTFNFTGSSSYVIDITMGNLEIYNSTFFTYDTEWYINADPPADVVDHITIEDSVLSNMSNDAGSGEFAIQVGKFFAESAGKIDVTITRSRINLNNNGGSTTTAVGIANGSLHVDSSFIGSNGKQVELRDDNNPASCEGSFSDGKPDAVFINSTLSDFDVDCGRLRQQWYLRGRSLDLLSNPVEGTSMSAFYQNGSTVWTESTDSDGFTSFNPTTTRTITTNNTDSVTSNISIQATKTGFTTVNTNLSLASSQTVTLSFLEQLGQFIRGLFGLGTCNSDTVIGMGTLLVIIAVVIEIGLTALRLKDRSVVNMIQGAIGLLVIGLILVLLLGC